MNNEFYILSSKSCYTIGLENVDLSFCYQFGYCYKQYLCFHCLCSIAIIYYYSIPLVLITADVLIRRKEVYPNPPSIPEGRWDVYLISLPNRPYDLLTITFHPLTPTIGLSPYQMRFEPDYWNVEQELTVIALEDNVNMESPYSSGFNLTLESEDMNYDGQELPDFNVTVEDNDEGITSLSFSSSFSHLCSFLSILSPSCRVFTLIYLRKLFQ